MVEQNIILIGMPGAGKSTIGVVLAKTLGMDFLDTDLLICKKTGQTLQEILDAQGQEAFLEIEKQVILDIAPQKTVIATGGSVPLKREAMEHLTQLGQVIYLKVPLEELEKRLSNIKTRGIAFAPGETLKTLYDHRVPIYESWADVTVETDPNRNDIEHMVEEIVENREESIDNRE